MANPPIRCLLMSPIAPPDPDNGDAQFTRDLLAHPPGGVEFVSYVDALASGQIRWGPSLKQLDSWRGSGRDGWVMAPRAGLHLIRRAGLLLPDPLRWVRVLAPFDVVHVHCMPVRFLGRVPPIVASDSSGTFWYWTAARGMTDRRVRRLLGRERRVARVLGYLHPSARPEQAARLLLFVDAGRALLEGVGASTEGALRCPPGVPLPGTGTGGDGRTLAFVGRDFEAKGGDIALRVLQRVRRSHPGIRLLVAGADGPDPGLDGVTWLGPRPREELYRELYARADLFLYPTRFDCAPLVVMEALAHGLPVVAPRAFALPELVRDGITGTLFRPGDIDGAAAAVRELLDDPSRLAAMRRASRRDFETRFSIERRNEILGGAYAEVAR
jgi:glycosyltransferase involved in cell wall biosynthesis